ncbi:MAG: hypothetical protein AB1429_12735 [Pseudomonadota bacterium]|jgi:hypothetical protein
MSDRQTHYELFVRKQPTAPWVLQFASEDRAKCLATAEELMGGGRVAAVRVTKEVLDPETREFSSATILTKGDVAVSKQPKKVAEDFAPMCVSPTDLYTVHARDRIGRLLDNWLKRKRVTVFELLHRPDLVELLDASGMEIQHAVQRLAVPEAQARGMSVHEVIRAYQALIDRSVDRLVKDGRKKVFPKLTAPTFAQTVAKCQGESESQYLLGGGVAAFIASAPDWNAKVGLILDLVEAAPTEPKACALAIHLLEQPLQEILGGQGALAEIIGPDQDLGACLALLTRVAAEKEAAMLAQIDPMVRRLIPPVEGALERLAKALQQEALRNVRAAVGKRILRELNSPKRLRPNDAEGEIALLRALAMCLTATGGSLVSADEVQEAFHTRSKSLVNSVFVDAYLADRGTVMDEAMALVKLADNVVGASNKRDAARWITATVGALKFERELREGHGTATEKLHLLANLQRALSKAGMLAEDQAAAFARIGDIGALVEADSSLTQQLARSPAPLLQKVRNLLRMAAGETAPIGPASEKAKLEALKLLRTPDFRTQMAASPETLPAIRNLLASAGLAA